jgi:hypothetical protein
MPILQILVDYRSMLDSILKNVCECQLFQNLVHYDQLVTLYLSQNQILKKLDISSTFSKSVPKSSDISVLAWIHLINLSFLENFS